jgi:hypothetical protein
LLTNALKHGTGDIYCRVRSRESLVRVLIGNRVARVGTTGRPGLGIGLRLVRALTDQLPGSCLALRSREWYWVRLGLPSQDPGSEI